MAQGRVSIAGLVVLCWAAAVAGLCGCGSDSGRGASSQTGQKIPLPNLDPETPYPVTVERGVAVIRPGSPPVTVYLDVFRPAVEGRFPSLLEAVAYRREILQFAEPDPAWLASLGYAVAIVDARGTGSSQGQWGVFSEEEVSDLAWLVDEWIPAQPWSNGKVGMYGPSYMGILQYRVAGCKPRHLEAIFPGVAMADAYRDIFCQGGILNQEFILTWAAGTIGLSLLPGTQLFKDPLSALVAFLEHALAVPEVLSLLELTTDQAFFRERSPMTYWADLKDLPVLASAGWLDIFTRGSLLNHVGLTETASADSARFCGMPPPRRILVGPWYHMEGAMLEGLPSPALHKRWFDWHLKARDDPDYAHYDILDPKYPVLLYVMGAEKWRKETSWPLDRARFTPLYLSGAEQPDDQNPSLNNGTLLWPSEWESRAAGGEGPCATSRITHAPPSYAGRYSRSTCRWLMGLTAFHPSSQDERENERITLTFSTGRLDRDLEVTGPAVLRLWARTRFGPPVPEAGQAVPAGEPLEPDVHWIVNLNDVHPDGRVVNLTSGWLAASHRPDPSRPDWTQPGYDPFDYPEDQNPVPPREGELYEYVIEIWPTSNLFLAGHQIRIDIANSDYPHLAPCPYPSESEILHAPDHPSRLILPIVDPESARPEQWIEDPQAYFSGAVPWEGS